MSWKSPEMHHHNKTAHGHQVPKIEIDLQRAKITITDDGIRRPLPVNQAVQFAFTAKKGSAN